MRKRRRLPRRSEQQRRARRQPQQQRREQNQRTSPLAVPQLEKRAPPLTSLQAARSSPQRAEQ